LQKARKVYFGVDMEFIWCMYSWQSLWWMGWGWWRLGRLDMRQGDKVRGDQAKKNPELWDSG